MTLFRALTDDIPETIECHGPARRVFSFTVQPIFPTHFNHSTGQIVQSEREMKDQLKYLSDKQSVESGFESHYEYLSPTDLRSTKELGVTEEGLDESRRRAHDALSD